MAKKMKQRILQTWMGVVTGSMGGRDDGYPQRKFAVYGSLEEAVRYCPGKDPEYFELIPIPERHVEAAQKQVAARRKREERASVAQEIRRLKRRLDSLK